MKRYVDDNNLRFLAYHSDTCLATGDCGYSVSCVFINQVRCNTVLKLFPTSSCAPVQVHGKLSHDLEYCSKEALFTKLGVEPAQGKRKDVGDVVQGKKRRKISETEDAQGLEIVDNISKNLRREYDTTSQAKDKILEVLKRQLETSKEETEEAQRISDDLKTQLETSKALAEEERRETEIYGRIQ
jgi:hypothetical protein